MQVECLFALQKNGAIPADSKLGPRLQGHLQHFATIVPSISKHSSSYFQALGSTIQRSTSKVCPTGRVHNAGHLKSTASFSVLPVNLSCYLDTYCSYHWWWLIFASLNLESATRAMHWKAWLSSELSVDGQPTQTEQNLPKVLHPLGSFFMSWPWIQESPLVFKLYKPSRMQSNKQSWNHPPERISQTRTEWSEDALATWWPPANGSNLEVPIQLSLSTLSSPMSYIQVTVKHKIPKLNAWQKKLFLSNAPEPRDRKLSSNAPIS